MHFQELILTLNNYWNRRGCLLAQPYDMEKGAATFNPSTFLRSLGPEPFDAAWAEPCRRPKDGRYGENPNRMQHYFQYQVVLKPSPLDILDLYIGSLVEIGIKPSEHDIRFVHDDWESPTLGAWGLGWEVWLDGMEITQFTYFQQVGGIDLSPIMGEITYGLERICMYLQKVDNVFKLKYNDRVTYGDIYHDNEVQFSKHNFELSDTALQARLFDSFEAECRRLCEAGVPAPAFDYCMKASHSFNLLDARGAISVNERQGYILRVRNLAKAVAEAWLKSREAHGYPLLRTARPATGPVGPHSGALSLMGAATAAHLPIPSAAGAEGADGSKTRQTAPLLVELGVEEMPARVFGPLLRDLPALLQKHLEPTLLEAKDIRIFATPRRIGISVGSILTRQPDQNLELKGPPASLAKDAQGNWTKAAEAFARKNGLDLAKLEIKNIQGGDYLFARSERKGREAAEILSEVFPKVFAEIHWYKTMRWGGGNVTPFVRPVLWLAALLGERVVPMSFAGVVSGAHSRGHRFLHNREVAVTAERKGYLDTLRAAKVIADPAERKDRIRRATEEAAAGAGLRWRKDEDLLDTVTYLVEWPVPVVGGFDERLLEIPAEVLVSEMKEHQKYFALERADGRLANAFIATANMECADYALVREGNEKVLRARFADAEFFLREDRLRPLRSRGEDLKKITFLADLGAQSSLAAKVARVGDLAGHIASLQGLAPGRPAPDLTAVRDIAALAKCDLTTNMVGEFPELQGIMGRYYAIAEGMPAKVADGIRDQYMPRNAEDGFPGSDEAAIVGIADRLDSLVVMFAKGKAPTGSADPFALRRACWTAVALIVNRGFRLDIGSLVFHAVESAKGFLKPPESDGLAEKLLEFFLARGKRLFQEESRPGLPGGFPADTVDAVVQSKAGWKDFTDMVDRLKALQTFRSQPAFGQAAETFKRVSNILPGALSGVLDADSLRVEEEKRLLRAVLKTEQEVRAGMSARSYVQVLGAVSALRGDVASLFDAVMVNDPDPILKQNRHLLLGKVRDLVGEIADFSAIQS